MIDPTIPLGIQPAQIQNPLTTLGQYQDMRNKLLDTQVKQQQLQSGQIGIQQAQQNQATQGSNRIAQQTAALLVKPDLSADDVVSTINNEVQQGSIPQQVANTWLQNVQQLGNDPGKLRTMLTAHLVGTLSGPDAVRTVFGAPTTINDGQSMVGGSQNGVLNPAGGGALNVAGGNVPLKMSPEAMASPRNVTLPSGQSGQVPASSVVSPTGQALPQMGSGRYGGGAQPAQPNAPAGFTPTSLPAGAQGSVDAYNAAQADVPQAVNRIAGLQKAYQALQQINSGPGTGTWQQIKSTLQSLPVVNGLAKPNFGDEDSIANYDSARKYMQDYANRATVGSTAQGLQAASHANASTDISQGAAADVLRTNIGLERMAVAQTKSATDPTSYLGHASDFATKFDRRGFSADMYSPDQLKKLVGGMGAAEKSKFFRSMGVASRLGLMQAPGQ